MKIQMILAATILGVALVGCGGESSGGKTLDQIKAEQGNTKKPADGGNGTEGAGTNEGSQLPANSGTGAPLPANPGQPTTPTNPGTPTGATGGCMIDESICMDYVNTRHTNDQLKQICDQAGDDTPGSSAGTFYATGCLAAKRVGHCTASDQVQGTYRTHYYGPELTRHNLEQYCGMIGGTVGG